MIKKISEVIVVFVFLSLSCSTGCSRENRGEHILTCPAQMNAPGYSIGVPTGAAATAAVEDKFPKCKIEYFASLHDAYLSVLHGKIDAFAFDRHAMQYMILRQPDLVLMDEKIADENIVVGAALGRDELMAKVNAFIRQYRADGTYQDMYERWLLGKNLKMPELPEPKNPAMELKIGTDGLNEPMNFYADGQLTGFDIEFVKRLALFLNAKVTFQTMEFSALVIAAISGKIDLLVANLNAMPERRKKMLFSDTYVDSEISLLVRRDRLPGSFGALNEQGQTIKNIGQLAGKKLGILTGSTFDELQKKQLPEAIPVYFNNIADQTEAVKSGKLAGFLVDEPIARDIVRNTPGLTFLPEMLCADGYAFAFSKSQADLQRQVNAALQEMKASGMLKTIDAKWFGTDESAKILPDFSFEKARGVLRFATTSSGAPFSYVKDGKIVGYDIEIAMRIAEKLYLWPEIVDMDFEAIIPSLISGKNDMAGCCITITEERAKSVLFSIPNYTGGVVVMVAGDAAARAAAGGGGFLSAFFESFSRTFLVEDRYKLVLQGLQVTIIISIFSGIFGTLLGFVVCMMRRSRSAWASFPARIFIRAIQGTPIVVLLMILYYIVFGSVDINAIFVAVVGFSIHFAAYVSEMMRTGIAAVDKGQHEAAAAMGFNRLQVFTRITFPQAARYVLPVFKGEFISMVKMTSVVGYIAIQDLTKMSDIIRSRTYEAFFPLIASALIYFAIAYLMTSLLSLVEIKIDPKRRKRAVKGVILP